MLVTSVDITLQWLSKNIFKFEQVDGCIGNIDQVAVIESESESESRICDVSFHISMLRID